MITDRGRWWAQPPTLVVQNSVASGDSFMGWLAVAAVRGDEAHGALCYAVAAGTVNAAAKGSAHVEAEAVEALSGEISLAEMMAQAFAGLDSKSVALLLLKIS